MMVVCIEKGGGEDGGRGKGVTCSLRTSGEPEPSVVMRRVPSGMGALSEYTQGDDSADPSVPATATTTRIRYV
mgnify:CR=1 FL=1